MRFIKNAEGDTIVEVLIAIAVASAVIAGSYTVVNRTLLNSQQAQEHSEALKVAEGQVEQLKKLPPSLASDSVFCYNKDNSGQVVSFAGVSVPVSQADYPAGCKGIGLAGFYGTAIQYSTKGTLSLLDDNYKVYVRWDGATGGRDEVSINYRVYAP
jgi:Tfp pilus assembly protein PilV